MIAYAAVEQTTLGVRRVLSHTVDANAPRAADDETFGASHTFLLLPSTEEKERLTLQCLGTCLFSHGKSAASET